MQFLEGVDCHDPITFHMSEGFNMFNCDKLQDLHLQNVLWKGTLRNTFLPCPS